MVQKGRRKVVRRKAPVTRRRATVRYRRRRTRIPVAPKNVQMIALRYNEVINLQCTAGTTGTAMYRLNDLYDPNYTASGHQSLYRDQYFALYGYARVLAAKIIVRPLAWASTDPLRIVSGTCVSGVADVDINTAIERKFSRHCFINSMHMSRPLVTYMTCDRFFGQAKGSTMRDTDFRQTVNGSLPNDKVMWWQILLQNVTGYAASLHVEITIIQYARFEQPLQQVSS